MYLGLVRASLTVPYNSQTILARVSLIPLTQLTRDIARDSEDVWLSNQRQTRLKIFANVSYVSSCFSLLFFLPRVFQSDDNDETIAAISRSIPLNLSILFTRTMNCFWPSFQWSRSRSFRMRQRMPGNRETKKLKIARKIKYRTEKWKKL